MDATIESLFAAVESNPDELQNYVVLADALAQAGDPRGELITIQHALSTRSDVDVDALRTRAAQLIAARRAALFEGIADVELSYRLGFLDELKIGQGIGAGAPDLLAAVMRSPESRLLRSLWFDVDEETHYLQAIFEALRPIATPTALRILTLGSAYPSSPGPQIFGDGEFGCVDDLTAVLDVFPSLAELRVDLGVANLEWAPLRSQRLRRFAYISPCVEERELAAFAGAELPALEAFTLWTGARWIADEDSDIADAVVEHAIGVAELQPVLAMLERCPALRELGICNFEGDLGELAEALAALPLIARIETLDLSACRIDSEAALASLLDSATSLRSLRVEHAIMDGETYTSLTERGLALAGDLDPGGLEQYRHVISVE